MNPCRSCGCFVHGMTGMSVCLVCGCCRCIIYFISVLGTTVDYLTRATNKFTQTRGRGKGGGNSTTNSNAEHEKVSRAQYRCRQSEFKLSVAMLYSSSMICFVVYETLAPPPSLGAPPLSPTPTPSRPVVVRKRMIII